MKTLLDQYQQRTLRKYLEKHPNVKDVSQLTYGVWLELQDGKTNALYTEANNFITAWHNSQQEK